MFWKKRPAPGEILPTFPKNPPRQVLVAEVAEFLGEPIETVGEQYDRYLRLHQAKNYEKRFGELKTLCFSEAFVNYAAIAKTRPERIVEIGTQNGKSTRRLLDMCEDLGLSPEVTCFDIIDAVEQFDPSEATLALEDITGRFRERVLEQIAPGHVYLDAHPWDLLVDVIGAVLEEAPPFVMTIHDCGRGLCNPDMRISKDDPEAITSHTGVWERHALASLLGENDPLSPVVDKTETEKCRVHVFGTPHGLGAVAPLSLVGN